MSEGTQPDFCSHEQAELSSAPNRASLASGLSQMGLCGLLSFVEANPRPMPREIPMTRTTRRSLADMIAFRSFQ